MCASTRQRSDSDSRAYARPSRRIPIVGYTEENRPDTEALSDSCVADVLVPFAERLQIYLDRLFFVIQDEIVLHDARHSAV